MPEIYNQPFDYSLIDAQDAKDDTAKGWLSVVAIITWPLHAVLSPITYRFSNVAKNCKLKYKDFVFSPYRIVEEYVDSKPTSAINMRAANRNAYAKWEEARRAERKVATDAAMALRQKLERLEHTAPADVFELRKRLKDANKIHVTEMPKREVKMKLDKNTTITFPISHRDGTYISFNGMAPDIKCTHIYACDKSGRQFSIPTEYVPLLVTNISDAILNFQERPRIAAKCTPEIKELTAHIERCEYMNIDKTNYGRQCVTFGTNLSLSCCLANQDDIARGEIFKTLPGTEKVVSHIDATVYIARITTANGTTISKQEKEIHCDKDVTRHYIIPALEKLYARMQETKTDETIVALRSNQKQA